MFPDDLLKRNQAFAAKRKAQPLPKARALNLAVVACFDPRLDQLLRPAVGLAGGEGFLLRTAGALVREGSTTLRSLAVAVLMFEVHEVFVLGHSTCRMASFKSNEFIESFHSRGVRRSAFGTEDLRNWAGAIPNPREGVKRSLAAIAAAPFVPSDILLAGGVLDDTTGRIDLVARPGEARSGGLMPASVVDEPDEGENGEELRIEDLPKGMPEVLMTIDSLASQPQMVVPVTRLHDALAGEQSVAGQIGHLERFLQEADIDTADLRVALARARRELADVSPGRLLRFLVPLIRKGKP